ncbi:hypothetical protein MRX96_051162 [Rhipicephalus microplus]
MQPPRLPQPRVKLRRARALAFDAMRAERRNGEGAELEVVPSCCRSLSLPGFLSAAEETQPGAKNRGNATNFLQTDGANTRERRT